LAIDDNLVSNIRRRLDIEPTPLAIDDNLVSNIRRRLENILLLPLDTMAVYKQYAGYHRLFSENIMRRQLPAGRKQAMSPEPSRHGSASGLRSLTSIAVLLSLLTTCLALAGSNTATTSSGQDVTEPVEEEVELLPCQPVDPELRPTVPAEGLDDFHGLRRVYRGKITGEISTIEVAQIKPVVIATRRTSSTKAIALTFDDGPHPTYTTSILDILAQHHAKATFFVLGIYTKKYPQIIRRQIAEGHEVAIHSWAHSNFTKLSNSAAANDIARCQKLLHSIAGAPVSLNWFRPPYGAKTSTVERVIAEAGLRTAMWSVDPADWRQPGSAAIYQHVMSHAHSGAVVLMHDGPAHREGTVKALRRIIPGLQKRGYQLVTMSQLAGLVPVFTGEVYLVTGSDYIRLAPAAEQMQVIIDGEPIQPEHRLLVGNGQLLLPMEPFIERLGASYQWDKQRQVVTISGLRGTLTLYLDSHQAEKDGEPVRLQVPPVLFKDAAFIPLWALANITGAQVRYDSTGEIIHMNTALSASVGQPDIRGLLDYRQHLFGFAPAPATFAVG